MIIIFIGTNNKNAIMFFIILIVFIIIALFQIIKTLYIGKMFNYDKKLRSLYIKNSIYVIIYFILHSPLIYINIYSFLNKNKIKENNITFTTLSLISTIITSSIPLTMSLIRIYFEFNRIEFIHQWKKRKKLLKKYENQNYNHLYQELSLSLTRDDPFEWLEKHRLKFLMRDIFVGISYCLNQKKIYIHKKKLTENESLNYIKYQINYNNFNISDESISKNDLIDIEITEYAPEIFFSLRKLEKIKNEEMIQSFLPQKNLKGIKESDGKSGSFFISTDDNKYMIKTLKYKEFELIRLTFLTKYINYLKENPESLICRIYGMYKLKMEKGKNILIIIMRNLIGDLKDNIICQYDLKGSTLNRKSNFDPQIVDKKVMKDLNFDEFEIALLFSENNSKKIREITKKDSEFLCNLELMDYSLFVVKLSLNKEIEKEFFGNDIEEIRNKEFNQLIEGEKNYNKGNEKNVESDSDNDINTHLLNEYYNNNSNINLNIYNRNSKYIFPSLQIGVGYIISIIDYFQYYNFFKLVETNFKRFKLIGKDKNSLSCVDPKTYSERFINFIYKITNNKEFIPKNKNFFEIEKKANNG